MFTIIDDSSGFSGKVPISMEKVHFPMEGKLMMLCSVVCVAQGGCDIMETD